MFYANHNVKKNRCTSSRTQRGQSIVIALLVLLLLGLAGALFVTIVARNILNANHANRVITADQYGRAGIVYADAQLSSSLDGADWRPALQYAVSDGTGGTTDYRPKAGTRERARYGVGAGPLKAADPNDPDKAYLDAGYSRYNTGAGRFLLRLTYDPVNVGPAGFPALVPPGKYVKIEAIGREGSVDPLDPTTYTNNRSSDRTQSYQVAYKPIGITDYARFETNVDKRSDIANLGTISEFYASDTDGGIATPGVSDFGTLGTQPTIREYPVLSTYGASDAYLKTTATPSVLYPNPNAGSGQAAPTGYTLVPGGGSVHANMPVRFFGKNVIYLNDAGATGPLFQDTAEVAGDLLLNSYDPNVTLDNKPITGKTATTNQAAALILNPAANTTPVPPDKYVAPSNGGFDTRGGLIRDGSMQNDPAGLPRGITRLEPPLIEALDSATQLPRYKALAMNSAPRDNTDLTTNVTTTYPTTASQYGYGKAIYINNAADTQPDSTSIGGGSTLTDEWLHGNAAANGGLSKGNWNGHFYDPPGVSIILGQLIAPATTTPTVKPAAFGLRLIRSAGDHWLDPAGAVSGVSQLDVKYSNLDTDTTGAASDNDIVIYAEGNVRVRGILSPNEGTDNTLANSKYIPRHITIVTNGTAYIEGNLLKGDPDSSITVLAHDYVCVNTTQFLAGPTTQEPKALQIGSDLLEINDNTPLTQEFSFGLRPGALTTDTLANGGYGTTPFLYVSGASNSSSTLADFDLRSLTGTPYAIAPVLTYTFSSLTPTRTTLPLTGLPALSQSDLGQLTVARDNKDNPSNPGDVLLERVAILPMDIRIEAVLYAQTRSFFVIPGEWFNSDSGDNLDSYQRSVDPADPTKVKGFRPGSAQDSDNTARYPMYGQPIDLKLTINGSVSEARPADVAAQTEWMKKWGWIPQYHGTLIGLGTGGATEPSGRTTAGQPSVGLQIIYDPQAGYPYNPGSAVAPAVVSHYLRSDKFGRPLPWTPSLPVSTGLLYSGESGEPPLLQ